jgi:hypothetical protein
MLEKPGIATSPPDVPVASSVTSSSEIGLAAMQSRIAAAAMPALEVWLTPVASIP